MKSPFQDFSDDHRLLVDKVGRAAGFAMPLPFEPSYYSYAMLRKSRKLEALPIDGVLVRDWSGGARYLPRIQLGARLYELAGIRFAVVRFQFDPNGNDSAFSCFVVDKPDYLHLYKEALRCRRDSEPASTPPVLAAEQLRALWENTIGYLDGPKLERIRQYGGRPRRGILLSGPPGNGKTMVCRWLWEKCRERNWEWKLVTPDDYRQARRSCDAPGAVRELFDLGTRGIIFFDDMDIALRNRDTVSETEDQAVFLTALDGISVKEGIVFIFTTNCDLALIDRAFKRPGRIDVALRFEPPDRQLRRRLIARWHAEIRAAIDLANALDDTEGYSFAELDEVRNLLVLHFVDKGQWNWDWAIRQFAANREDLALDGKRIGFDRTEAILNGA